MISALGTLKTVRQRLSVAKSLEEQQERFENLMGQTAKARGINKLRPMFDWVEDANQTTENAARLATYIEARKLAFKELMRQP